MAPRLTVLGSGGIRPDLQRQGPAYLLEAGETRLLFDAGPGVSRGLLRAGFSTAELSGIAITHRHPDHMAELLLLLELERIRSRDEPLALLGPAMLDAYLDFMAAWGRDEPRSLPFPLRREIMPGACRLGPMQIKGSSVPHVTGSVGYRMEVEGKVIVYAGDCGPGAEVAELGRGADLLVLECSLPPGQQTAAHLNPQQAALLATMAGAKRVLLCHFPPEADSAAAVRVVEDAGLSCSAAEDGLVITLS